MVPSSCHSPRRSWVRLVPALAVAALTTPAAVYAAAPCYQSLSLGGFHGLAVASNTTHAFGEDVVGQSDVPSSLAGSTRAVAAGGFFSCALHSAGLSCWGASGSGATTVPSAIASDPSVRALYAGGYHACALLGNDTLTCWGANGAGQVSPLPGAAITGPVATAALGAYHGCALISSMQAVTCWGKDDAGQVSGVPHFLYAGGAAGSDTGLTAGGAHSCAWGTNIATSSAFRACWGSDSAGQSTIPASIASAVTSMCAGGYFTCALAGGSVSCWGSAAEGETAVPSSAQDGAVTGIACGWYGACALKSSGSFVCWGGSLAGEAASTIASMSLDLSTAAVSTSGAVSGGVFISSGASGASASGSGALSFISGDAAVGNSGPVVLATGAATAGTRGAISLLAPHIDLSGALTSPQISANNVTARNLTVGSTALSEEDLIGLLTMLRNAPVTATSPTATPTPSVTPSSSAAASHSITHIPSTSATATTSPSASASTSSSPSAAAVVAPFVVSTLAGCGSLFFTDGPYALAGFSYPAGIVVDASGVVYVADTGNNAIRKIANGNVSTLAGGNYGLTDGQGTAARFNSPAGIAVDASGTLYVADRYNHAIRSVTSSGAVTTLAGSGAYGYTDGQGAAARFNGPNGIAVDASGLVYVADSNNNAIRKVAPDGTVTTLAGGNYGFTDGQGTAATFASPAGLTIDASGVLYVADPYNNAIRKVTADGTVTTLAGGSQGFADGQGTAATFTYPFGLSVTASGVLYVADTYSYAIRKITADGTVTTVAGSGSSGYANGQGAAAAFNSPNGIAVDASGTMYVVDTNNNAIRSVTSSGAVTTLTGSCSKGFADGQGTTAALKKPSGLALDASGVLYVGDADNHAIRKVSTSGLVSTLAGRGTSGFVDGQGIAAAFNQPYGVALDSSGTVYVADTSNNRIRKVSASGAVTTLAGSGSFGFDDGVGTAATFFLPYGIAVDGSGVVYVADTYCHRIRKVAADGTVTTLAGSGSGGFFGGGNADGQGAAALFKLPYGIAVDSSGTLYVADYNNMAIRKVTSTGDVTTLAGSRPGGFADGQGAAGLFGGPQGVALDAAGNVYVADTINAAIRKVTPTGAVTTLAGGSATGHADGPAATATFNDPFGIVVSSTGTVYVGDQANNRIRTFNLY